MKQEMNALKDLLSALEEQHKYIAHNQISDMVEVVDKIDKCNREVAKIEMERREITHGEPMKKIVKELHDKELEQIYRDIKKLLEQLQVQKDHNELLIRKGLSFSTQMLNLLKPDQGAKTYNSYGRSR